MGIWTSMTVFEVYANFLRLGIINGMNREIPLNLGRGNHELVNRYAETTLGYTLVNIVSLLLIAPVIFTNFTFDIYHIATISVSIVRVCLTFYTTYLLGTFRSENHFKKLTYIQYFLLAVQIVLSFLSFIGFYGFLLFQLLYVVVNAVLLHIYRPIKVRPTFHKPELIHLFKVGFPIFLASYVMSLVDTLPRLYIIYFGTSYQLGLYAPILILISAAQMLPNSILSYMYPKLLFEYGKNNNPKKIMKMLLEMYIFSLAFLVIIALTVLPLIDYVIKLVPKYVQSVEYIKLSLMLIPLIIFKLTYSLNVVMKKYGYMYIFLVTYFIVQSMSLYAFSFLYKDIIRNVIVSQIFSAVVVLSIGIFLNYSLVKGKIAVQSEI